MRPFSLWILCLGFSCALASEGAAFKYLKLGMSARTNALAGAGSAWGATALEASQFPALATTDSCAWISGSQQILNAHLGAKYNSLWAVQSLSPQLRLGFGGDFLVVDPLSARDEDGFSTGKFGANSWTPQLGLAWQEGAWGLGFSAQYTQSTLAELTARALLANAQVTTQIRPWLRSSVAVLHAGWASAYDQVAEPLPLTFQSGLATQFNLGAHFVNRIMLDLRGEVGLPYEPLVGWELEYAHLMTLRLGYNASAPWKYPSAGLGLRIKDVFLDYAYSGAPLNTELGGSHHLSLGLAF